MTKYYYSPQKTEELKKLKAFFEQVMNEKDRKDDSVDGTFGTLSCFFGNVIQWNSFDIPHSAMKLIYLHNKKYIDDALKEMEEEK